MSRHRRLSGMDPRYEGAGTDNITVNVGGGNSDGRRWYSKKRYLALMAAGALFAADEYSESVKGVPAIGIEEGVRDFSSWVMSFISDDKTKVEYHQQPPYQPQAEPVEPYILDQSSDNLPNYQAPSQLSPGADTYQAPNSYANDGVIDHATPLGEAGNGVLIQSYDGKSLPNRNSAKDLYEPQLETPKVEEAPQGGYNVPVIEALPVQQPQAQTYEAPVNQADGAPSWVKPVEINPNAVPQDAAPFYQRNETQETPQAQEAAAEFAQCENFGSTAADKTRCDAAMLNSLRHMPAPQYVPLAPQGGPQYQGYPQGSPQPQIQLQLQFQSPGYQQPGYYRGQ